jgi:putative transposase
MSRFHSLDPGTTVSVDSKRVVIVAPVSATHVLVRSLHDGSSQRVAIDTLRPDTGAETTEQSTDLTLIAPKDWSEAERRMQLLLPLLRVPKRSRSMVETYAHETGVSTATLYRWLQQYEQAGYLASLVPNRRGQAHGTTRLDDEMQAIVSAAIESVYLTEHRGSAVAVIRAVARACRIAGRVAPAATTIRRRIGAISPAETDAKRGRRDLAIGRYAPMIGSHPDGATPLQTVQIDHTLVDLILVDEAHRQPIGRPYLTLAVDVYSRMIVGFYLSFDPPGATSVGVCIAHAMCQKREYLARLGVAGHWPVWGKPAAIHVDNAKEFRGTVLDRACAQYGITLMWRPIRTPRFGGTIERLIGTAMTETHLLPGTTFSNPAEKRGYPAEKRAAMTLREYEAWFADFVVNFYHRRRHSALNRSPLDQWEIGVLGTDTQPGIGFQSAPSDPLRLTLDFLPIHERTIQQYGVQIDGIAYYDPVLAPFIRANSPTDRSKRKTFVFRQDPRDVSRIYFFDTVQSAYVPIPYRNLAHPPASQHELRLARAALRESGRDSIDEDALFQTLERMHAQVDASVARTKSARRTKARSPRTTTDKSLHQSVPGMESARPAPVQTPGPVPLNPSHGRDDLFATPVAPYDTVESRA